VCKSIDNINPSELGSRKKLSILQGIEIDGYYCALFATSKKSRFLKRDALDIFELLDKLEKYKNFSITRLYLLTDSDICSKAKMLLENNGWLVFDREYS